MNTSPGRRVTPVGRPAKVARPAYALGLPPSGRRLGGAFTVDQAARKLSIAFHLHHQLMRAIAGRLIDIAEFELKVELAHHLYLHADAAQSLRGRLQELRVAHVRLEAAFPAHIGTVAAELLQAEGPAEFVMGLHVVLGGRLAEFERRYFEETDGLADLPSRRILERTLSDLDGMATWGGAVVEAFVRAGASRTSLEAWRDHLEGVVDDLGGLDGSAEAPSRPLDLRAQSRGPFRRAVGCARDDRLTTFHHTRDYKGDDGWRPGRQNTGYEADRLEVIRVQRDELDAIETFANVLHDFEDAPFEFQMALARFVWDEARHSEIGQQSLERLGYDPFDVPCGIIGINVRSPLPPLQAFAQINTFGELNQVGHLRRVAQAAYRQGDSETGRCIDFIHADEMTHVRRGREWLKRLVEKIGTSVEAVEEEARRQAIRRLREEGVLNEDYGERLTASELARMLGE